MSMESFKGKKFLVTGIANDYSIAWGVAQMIHARGGDLCLTYPNEMIEKRLRPLAESIGCDFLVPCDVQSDLAVDMLVKELNNRWGRLDGLLHSIAYASKKEMEARFADISRSGFLQALDISTYSLLALAGRAAPLLKKHGGSVIALTYLGSERVVPNYSVMGVAKAALEASVRYLAADLGQDGVRVNAISAGPIKTLAAMGIPQFKQMHHEFATKAPLRRNTTQEDVANTAGFLFGQYSTGITGEVMFVDCGYNVMGV